MVNCPVCNTTITEDHARFCHQCGYRIVRKEEQQMATERLKMWGGESRILSVFFVNFSGFEQLLEDQSELQIMLDIRTCLNETDDIIKKLGGTANQILPDMRVLGIFGAPKAHADDPARVVRCAWRIHEWWQKHKEENKTLEKINITMGINTGRAFFGYILEKTPFLTVIGDTINTAARLTEICPRGKTLMSDSTYEKTDDIAECEHMGKRTVKGKSEQINVYLLEKIKDIQAAPVQTIPFVGRKDELQQLGQLVNALSDNKERFCIISGQMGIGKSRLKEEFEKHLTTLKNVHYLETHCSSEVSSPYFPFKFLLRRYFDINEYDGADNVDLKIRTVLAKTTLTATEAKGFQHLFLTDMQHLGHEELVSVNEEIYIAVKSLLRYECSVNPFVLIFEEFNRADSMSKKLIAYLATELKDVPIMFLMVNVSREFLKDVAVDIHEIALNSLQKSDINDLVIAILDRVEDRLVEFIYKSAGGNPLFTIETIRNTQRTNLIRKVSGQWQLEREQRLSFLDDLYGVVMSTIDSLPADYRLIIDFASVIGYSFSVRLLKQLLDSTYLGEQLRYLVEEGYIVMTRESDDPIYVFRHNLLKDAAYTVLPLRKRKEIHARVAQLFEDIYADRLSEFYEQIGHHYLSCENFKKAAAYFKFAGDKAKNLFAIDQAIGFYNLLFKFEKENQYNIPPEIRQDILMNFTDIYEIQGDMQKMERAAEQGLEITRELRDIEREMEFSARYAHALFLKNHYDKAEDILLTTIDSCAEKKIGLLPVLYSALGYLYQFKYEYEKSMINYNLSWNAARDAKNKEGEVSCLYNLAQLHINLGNYEQALEYIDYCLDDLLGDEEKRWRTQFTYLKSEIYRALWDLEKASDVMQACQKQADELGYTEFLLKVLLDIALVNILRKEGTDILEYVNTVDNKVTFLIRDHLLATLNYKKGSIFMHLQDATRAKDYVNSALASAERLNQKEIASKCFCLLSQLDDDKSIEHATSALEIAETIKLPPLIGQALYRLTEIYKMKNDLEKARYYGRKALLVFDDMKFKLQPEHVRIFSQRPEYNTLMGV